MVYISLIIHGYVGKKYELFVVVRILKSIPCATLATALKQNKWQVLKLLWNKMLTSIMEYW